MKKIGVITFHRSLSYGAFFQCLALQKVIKKLGYSPCVIDYENPSDKKKYELVHFDNPERMVKDLLTFPQNYLKRRVFYQCFSNLIKCGGIKETYDVAVTGSDQVFNPKLTGGSLDGYFTLEKIKAKKKISYAASLGDLSCVDEKPEEYKTALNGLDSISLREVSAKEKVKKLTRKKITICADPTLLLEYDDWASLLNGANNPLKEKDYIFSYFIAKNASHTKGINKISDDLGMKILSYSLVPKEKNILKYCYTDNPLLFLARLRDAKLVITSSFHGVALSVALRKNFYCLMPDSKKRNRIDDLLGTLGLKDRIIESEADISKINLDDIDYTEPQKKLDKLRRKSLNWLRNAIEGKNE